LIFTWETAKIVHLTVKYAPIIQIVPNVNLQLSKSNQDIANTNVIQIHSSTSLLTNANPSANPMKYSLMINAKYTANMMNSLTLQTYNANHSVQTPINTFLK